MYVHAPVMGSMQIGRAVLYWCAWQHALYILNYRQHLDE
jgi:hypothetical protein